MKTIYEFLLSEHLLKSKTSVSTQGIDCVDLELPSGLLWTKCNIGAKEPTDYGDYFMWGSTESDTDKSCEWKNCPFNNGNDTYNKRYFKSIKNKVCPNSILAPEYDAASIIMSNDCRLPTQKDFKELIDNTKHEWVENYQDSKINGMVFTPMGFEANGAELFIPAAGYHNKTSFYDKGSHAFLWSSSLNTSNPNSARILYATEYSYNIYNNYRCAAMPLRAIKE